MQKDIRLAVFLAALLTLIWAAPLPASQMSLSATHNFIVTLTSDAFNTTIEPIYGASVSAFTQGQALYPKESNYDADNADGNAATATASFPAMTWLQTNYSSIKYWCSPSGNSTFNWSTTLVGYGGGYL